MAASAHQAGRLALTRTLPENILTISEKLLDIPAQN
jgi:hypothetical protein